MLKTLKKWWKYLGAKLNMSFSENADPKVQLEQAITEAEEQHRRLKEQAANVIANQTTTQMQLDRKTEELAKVNANARQAVLMADEATKSGDTAKAAEYSSAAEAFANKLISLEREVEGLKALVLQAAQATDQAKAAVAQNSAALQRKLAEKQKLLSQLDQAKMQEQLTKTLGSLSETVGQDIPTFDEITRKIESRQAKAMASAELEGSTVEAKMLEVEHASLNVEAQSRLEQIRSEMGIGTAPAAAAAAAPQAAAEPATATEGETPAS
ncbi:MAG: PspA/IM30 family protein [Acidimicrobiales bacterium]